MAPRLALRRNTLDGRKILFAFYWVGFPRPLVCGVSVGSMEGSGNPTSFQSKHLQGNIPFPASTEEGPHEMAVMEI